MTPIVRTHVGSAARPTEPFRPVLDAEIIGRLERLGESTNQDLLGQLIALFRTDADTRIDDLRRALAEGDAGAVLSAAHSLRGASANLGARGLSDLCARLESDAALSDLSTADLMLDALEAELLQVHNALQQTVVMP